jgi:UPF0042 nucleotide-binding protein
MKKFVIITGLSGAGKSSALKFFEDTGYYCIDNLPCTLIPDVIDFLEKAKRQKEKIAFTVDIREEEFFDHFEKSLDVLKEKNKKYTLIFLEANRDIIIRRFEETRRTHPLQKKGFVLKEAVDREREMLMDLKERSNIILDTSELTIWDLRNKLKDIFEEKTGMSVEIITFGFKYGMPSQLDLLFDVRFLPNPHYIEELRKLNGIDIRVKKFVLEKEDTKDFLLKLKDLLNFLIPLYEHEGKIYLVIGFGCTGGTHRSVVIGEEVKEMLGKKGYRVNINHRDIGKTV